MTTRAIGAAFLFVSNASICCLAAQEKTANQAAASELVKVETGLLQGTVEDGLRIYRGIPYAAPPVGELRWRPPQPAQKWEGVRAAGEYGRACMQTNAPHAPASGCP